MDFSPGSITALVVAASFAGGLNIYATVLTLGLLTRMHWVALPPGLDSLGHTWVLAVCAVMFAIEFVADKIPAFDMMWNVMHTVVRVPVAAVVAYHASAQLSPQMQMIATVAGAAVALTAHSSKTALRAVVAPSPEPVSNVALSSAEDAMSIGLTWFATRHPVIAASIAMVFLAVGILAARVLLRAIHQPMRRMFGGTARKTPAAGKPSVE